MKDLTEQKIKISKASLITLFVFIAVLGVMMTTFCVLYAINKKAYTQTSANLETVYKRSFYDLVENINNAEIKLGKLVNSSNDDYTKKLLSEVHENASSAENNLSFLPISMNGIPETIRFINQLNGFSKTLTQKNNFSLSSNEIETLQQLHNSVSDIKYKLNEMSKEISNGYNIFLNSTSNLDYNSFTKLLQNIKSTSEDYPSMIYDGPFSNSVVNKEIKGLSGEEITKEKALEKAKEIFEFQEQSIQENNENGSKQTSVKYIGETKGRFNTFDFEIVLENGFLYYAQITKIGGNLLTLSSFSNNNEENISIEKAIEISNSFLEKQGINNMQCVWHDTLNGDIYLNFASVENNVVLYPDLIKIKVDLATGNLLGFEASTYYTNHCERTLQTPSVSIESLKNKIPDDFKILKTTLSLSPLDYNREVLTYEFKCFKNGVTYYFYFNAKNGNLENMLQVVSTSNGNLLM